MIRSAPFQVALYGLMASIWGSSFFFTVIALRAFNPFSLPLIRMAIATSVLSGVVFFWKIPFPNRARLYGHSAVLGALNIACPYILLTWAQLRVNSSTASVLSSTTPIFVFLFSWLVVGEERFTVLRGMGILLAFFGAALFAQGGPALMPGGGAGALAIILTSTMLAAGNVYTSRFLAGVHPVMIAFLQIGIGTAYLLAVGLLCGDLEVRHATMAPILAVLELGLLGSAVTFLLFFHFIQTLGSTAASLNIYLQPAVGMVLGVLVLGERITGRSWLCLGAVLLGIAAFGIGTVWPRANRR